MEADPSLRLSYFQGGVLLGRGCAGNNMNSLGLSGAVGYDKEVLTGCSGEEGYG